MKILALMLKNSLVLEFYLYALDFHIHMTNSQLERRVLEATLAEQGCYNPTNTRLLGKS